MKTEIDKKENNRKEVSPHKLIKSVFSKLKYRIIFLKIGTTIITIIHKSSNYL